MRVRLTDRAVSALRATGQRYEAWDTTRPAFGVRVGQSGKKSFVFTYHWEGKPRRLTLGQYPRMSLADAGVALAEARRQLEHGVDPGATEVEKRRQVRATPTVCELAEEYLEKHCKPNKRSWHEDERVLNHDVLPAWGSRKGINNLSLAEAALHYAALGIAVFPLQARGKKPLPNSDRLNEPLLKELTGGDTLTARFLFKEFFDYRPSFKIIMSVNDLPRIEAGDAAINRRIHVVPFSATFEASTCDKDLPEKLREELSGILAWVVEGCMAWQRQGLNSPSTVRSATAQYIGTNDMLGEFIKEHCTLGDSWVSAKDFFTHYSKWLRETYGEETNKVAVGRLMRKKGFASKLRSGERVYEGVTYNHPRF